METLEIAGVEMVSMTADDMLAVASAQVLRNTRMTFLIDQAHKLPYCKRNILLTKLFFWDIVLDDLVSRILNGIKDSRRKVDVNDICLDHILENNLAQKDFAEFFFKMHDPLTKAFLKMIARETANGLPISEKITLIVTELTELLNIAAIELEGLDLNCELFGASPICSNFKVCGVPDCHSVSNVYTLVMCKEYFLEDGLFNRIVASVGNTLPKDEIIMVVDYQDMRNNMPFYDWEASGGLERLEVSSTKVSALYFYNTEGFVNFGASHERVAPYIIPNKEALLQVKTAWKEKKELVLF